MRQTMNYKMRFTQKIKHLKTKSCHIDIRKCITKRKDNIYRESKRRVFNLTTCSDDIVDEIDGILKTFETQALSN